MGLLGREGSPAPRNLHCCYPDIGIGALLLRRAGADSRVSPCLARGMAALGKREISSPGTLGDGSAILPPPCPLGIDCRCHSPFLL